MAQPTIKTSFASGEWAPKLRSRVDVQKYHSGAALLRNFFVDYSGGGASTRQGTHFLDQVKVRGARLIPFQPSTSVAYVLEFGQNYIRFYSNGAPIVETAVTGGTAASGNTFTIANSYSIGDWVLASAWGGLTNVNGNVFIVSSGTTGAQVVVTDLNGNAVTFSGTYTSGGQLQRIYTITSPYLASDLFPNQSLGNPGLKFVQDVTSLIITHPSYPAQVLTIISATNWTLTAVHFASTIASPTITSITTNSAAGSWDYAYQVTAVDANGQESAPSAPAALNSINFIGNSNLVIIIGWSAVAGAVSYNVYKASPLFGSAVAIGSQFGFIGNVTSAQFTESTPGIAPDFAQTPPIPENPFVGAGIVGYTITASGSYTVVPAVSVGAPSNGTTATAAASISVLNVSGITHAGGNQDIITTGGDPTGALITFSNGIVVRITAAVFSGGSTWGVQTVSLQNGASLTGVGNSTPTNPVTPSSCTAPGFIGFGNGFGISFNWGVTSVIPVSPGSGYTSVPTVSFSPPSAAATAIVGTAGAGNPGVPGFFQERLVLAGQQKAIQSFNMSQPGSFFNFNTTNPVQPDDAISASIIAEDLNDIRWLIGVPSGLLAGTGKGAFLINGGGGISTQVPIEPTNATAQPQSFNGANDLKPLKINFDLLYVTNKGNYVRDLAYNIYVQVFNGADISTLSNHLFFGFSLIDWCFAEEPFKTAWMIRNDGIMLSLAYVKEQDLIGFAHHDTNGQFKSVCSVIEPTSNGVVDAVYVIAERFINGNLVQYVERMADRYFPYGYEDSWSVDAGLQTAPALSQTSTLSFVGNASAIGNSLTLTDSSGPFTSTMATNNWVVRANGGIYKITAFTSATQVTASVVRVPSQLNPYTNTPYNAIGGYSIWTPVSTVSGLTQLVGQSVVGVADGVAIGPFVVSATGSVALGVTATKVTLGLSYLPQLQTLPLDLGEPTVQGKRKKIVALTLRVADTLGLSVGKTFSTLVSMKDFLLGNVPSTSSGVASVTDLINGDGRTIIDQDWETAGNYCVQQNLPYPATVLGVFPEVVVGDTK